MDSFCWTYDPRLLDTPYVPFDLFPRQVEFLQWLEQVYKGGNRALAEKCRDVGFTWLCCSFLLWGLLFVPGFKGTVGSRKVDLVDKMGDLDTILEKVRFMIQWLPEWEDWKAPEIQSNYLKIANKENGAIITGEGGDNMGRGGRSSIYIVDEAAFIERPSKVDAAISANSAAQVKVSTPNGMGNPFAEQVHSGKFPVFVFDWREDPRKTEEWYQKQKLELDPITFAQEVERDYGASTPGVLIRREWVMAATRFKCEPLSLLKVAGLDVADEGSNKNVLVFAQMPVVQGLEAWMGENTTETAYRALEECKRNGVKLLNFDAVGVGAGVGATFKVATKLDPALSEWTATRQVLQEEQFFWAPIKSGGSPTNSWWAAEKRKSADKFKNLRAEMGWRLRERFRKTHDRVEGIYDWPIEECISIPNNAELVRDLSIMRYFYTTTGQIQLISKDELRKENIKSPDYYDALVMAAHTPMFYPAAQLAATWG